MTDQSEMIGGRNASRQGRGKQPDPTERFTAPRATLIVGMHRSGTSALTRLFNLLGADLPNEIMPPGRGNKAGHWESDALRKINDQILASGHSFWDDWRAFDPAWYDSADADSYRRILIRRLERDFGASRFFALKDPRICRILPLWLDVLNEVGAQPSVVIPIRNPIEVAESLQQRDGIAPAKSYLLWLRHVLDAERGSRGLPRAVTTYDALLEDWGSLAATVAMRCEFTWPTTLESAESQVDEFLASRFRHHVADPEQFEAAPDLIDWLNKTYAIMTCIARVGDDDALLARLDRIAAAFDKASVAFGAVLSATEAKGHRQVSRSQQGLASGDLNALASGLSQVADKQQATDSELAAAREALSKAHRDLRQMQVAYDRTQTELEAARAEVKKYNEKVLRLSEGITKARDELGRRNAELNLLHTELDFVRVLSAKRRDAAVRSPVPIDESPSMVWSTAAFCEQMLLAAWRKLRGTWTYVAEVEAISKSGLFDEEWYLERYPDVARLGVDPLYHYIKHGGWEGRDPHALFDADWYHATYPEVANQELTPLAHFVCIGAAKGYDPNPFFHTDWYVAHNPDVNVSQINPLRHYIEHAAEEGRNPNPLFDSAWYLREYFDVVASGENPLSHYIHRGVGELRDPHPLFDTEWYLEQYEHVIVSGVDALEHYLTVGAFEGCRPVPAVRDSTRGHRTKRQPRSEPQVARLADWLAADFGSIAGDEATSSPSPSPVDTLSWQIKLGTKRPVAPRFAGQVGVFVHLFYEDLAEEIASSLLAIPFDFKVYVSTNSKEKQAVIDSAFRRNGLEPVIKIVPNRGWDIAPLLLGFGEEMRNHEICLKLHGKRSRFNSRKRDTPWSRERGARWRRYLLSGLLGSPRNVAFIVDSFSAHPDLGVLMTHHWNSLGRTVNFIGVNYRPIRALLRRIGLSISPEHPIEFPSGSMFWFRTAALQPLFDVGLTWPDFNECRARKRDATIAHGIERCILIFAAKAGFKWAFVPNRWTSRNWRPQPKRGPLQALRRTREGSH